MDASDAEAVLALIKGARDLGVKSFKKGDIEFSFERPGTMRDGINPLHDRRTEVE